MSGILLISRDEMNLDVEKNYQVVSLPSPVTVTDYKGTEYVDQAEC